MTINNLAVAALRIMLVVGFAILVPFEIFSLPGQWAHMAKESPEDAYLRWPLTAITVFWVICTQAVIVCTWKLLSLVRADRIFSDDSMKWVDGIVWAVTSAWVVLVGLFLYVGFKADDPGLPVLLFLLVVGGAVLTLLILVMRALLRQATTLRTDMEAVI